MADPLVTAAALLLALAAGGGAFFTATARVPFDVLGREAAGRLATAMFPRYYAWQTASAGLAALALAAARDAPAAAGAGAASLLALVGWAVILPRMRRVGREDPTWGRWHAASVVANLLSVLAAAVALVLAVT